MKGRVKKWSGLVLFLLIDVFISSFQVKGQGCCSGGTPLLGNLGIRGIEEGTLYIELAFDYNALEDLYSGTRNLDDPSRTRETYSGLLQVAYAFHPNWSVNALFSYVRQERTTGIGTSGEHQTAGKGIGDAVVLLQYRLVPSLKDELVIAFGPKLPIGKHDARDPSNGVVLPPDLQPGSAAWDLIGGFSYRRNNLLELGFGWSTVLSYRLTTEGERFDGDNGYKFGNEFIVSTGLDRIYFVANQFQFTPSLFFNYRQTEPDQIEGVEVGSTGGKWFYLIPGLSVAFSPQWGMNLSGELPLYRNLQGTQLTTSYRLNAGIYWTFKSGKSRSRKQFIP